MQHNINLTPYNSFGIAALAKKFATFESVEMLQKLLNENGEAPLLLLGGGSNILLTQNFDGLVLKNDLKGIELVQDSRDAVLVRAAAGEVWHQFVLHCTSNNFAGVENLSLIPGSVGASPMQNIGAYGVEIKDVFHSLEAMEIATGAIKTFYKDDCAFGYRESIFKHEAKNRYVILSVTFQLSKLPKFNTSYGAIEQELAKMNVQDLSIQAISQAVINIRQSKLPDPRQIGNAGSFFKNPEVAKEKYMDLNSKFENIVGYELPNGNVKLAAGWLIEQCGWKGYRNGDAGCHAKQALVLVNYGNAKGSEIVALAKEIIASVQEKFGVTLKPEVNII